MYKAEMIFRGTTSILPRRFPARALWAVAFAALLLILLASVTAGSGAGNTASATERVGGLTVPADPSLDGVECVKLCVAPRKATPGAIVRFTGAHLDDVRKVVFPGKDGRQSSRPVATAPGALRVKVPHGSDDGHPFAIDGAGAKSNRVPSELKILPASAIPTEVFPVDGPVDFGSSGARFGAGRNGHTHQGQDIIAACGLPILNVRRATVAYNAYDGNAGNYVVMKNKGSNTSFAYMHLVKPSKLKIGHTYDAGRKIGRVGETGDAVGCHLHFEYWVGPWQTGGRPIDPLPFLKSLK